MARDFGPHDSIFYWPPNHDYSDKVTTSLGPLSFVITLTTPPPPTFMAPLAVCQGCQVPLSAWHQQKCSVFNLPCCDAGCRRIIRYGTSPMSESQAAARKSTFFTVKRSMPTPDQVDQGRSRMRFQPPLCLLGTAGAALSDKVPNVTCSELSLLQFSSATPALPGVHVRNAIRSVCDPFPW